MSGLEHGYAKYCREGCRCYVCAFAASQYTMSRKRAISEGRWQPYVDAEPVRQHLRTLMAGGIGYQQICTLSGVHCSVISKLLYGTNGRPKTKLRPAIAAKLLAVELGASCIPRGHVDATGVRRRIQALTCLGWTFAEQARRVGWDRRNFTSLLAQQRVRHDTAKKIAELYDELSMTVAPAGHGATKARAWAQRHGWLPPLAWDDDEIDDPGVRKGRHKTRITRPSLLGCAA